MKLIQTTFLACCIFLLYSFKPTPNVTQNTLDKALNTNNSLLWQISGNGLTKPSYIYGTIHIISNDDYFLGKNIEKKLKKSDALVMEIDLDKMDVTALAALSVLDSGKTIRNYMNDTDYFKLQTFMTDTIGIKKYTFEKFYTKLKPLYLEQLIFFRYAGQEKESYEVNFKKIADQKNIPTIGLETFEEQLRFMDEIPLDIQLKSIVKTTNNYANEIKNMDTLILDYKAQNLTALTKQFEEDENTLAKEHLLDKRNNNWISKLRSLITTKSCFIAVGAGHLGGQKGLIELLKKEGYTVVPISIN